MENTSSGIDHSNECYDDNTLKGERGSKVFIGK